MPTSLPTCRTAARALAYRAWEDAAWQESSGIRENFENEECHRELAAKCLRALGAARVDKADVILAGGGASIRAIGLALKLSTTTAQRCS